MNAKAASAVVHPLSGEPPAGDEGRGTEIFSLFSSAYARERREIIGLTDYLERCRDDRSMYASAPERMIAAVGEPEVIDTSRDQRLGRDEYDK